MAAASECKFAYFTRKNIYTCIMKNIDYIQILVIILDFR